MRILFLSHYFPPEVNAPAGRTYDHCVRWARAGHEVIVITSAPNCPDGVLFPGYRNTFRRQEEDVEGVRVVRVWTYLAPNCGTFRRILNYLSYMFAAVLAALRLPRPDVVVATSPQFFCGWAGVFAARFRRAPLVLEIRDIWPESIVAVGAMRRGKLLSCLRQLERWMYRASNHIVAVGHGYRGQIIKRVGLAERISVVHNGVDLTRFVPRRRDPDLVATWGLTGRFVCSYVGTIGMAHDLDVIIEAAKLLRAGGRRDVGFLLVGDGAERRRLEARVRDERLDDFVVFTGRQPKEAVPAILASSDTCLIHVRKCLLFETVIPSKIFETMAMCRPIILGVEGEAREIVREASAGIAIEPGSAAALIEAIDIIQRHGHPAGDQGRQARRYVAAHYGRDALADRYLRLLEEIASGTAVVPEPIVPAGAFCATESSAATAFDDQPLVREA